MALVLRIPVLIALLLVSGPLQWEYALLGFRLNVEGLVAGLVPWLGLVAIAIVFLLVANARRDRRHPGWVLGLEGLVATVITFLPPLAWTMVTGNARVIQAVGGNSSATYAQILALVWLLVVIRTVRGQRRAA